MARTWDDTRRGKPWMAGATRAEERDIFAPFGADARLALFRRRFEMGQPIGERALEALRQANAAALDALSRVVGDALPFVWLPGVEEGEARRMVGHALASAPPCGQAGTSRWCPHPLGHGGPCTVDWAVVEGPADPDPDPDHEGPKPSCIDRLRAAFEEGERLDATMTEAEKETDRRINPVPWYRGQNGRKGAE